MSRLIILLLTQVSPKPALKFSLSRRFFCFQPILLKEYGPWSPTQAVYPNPEEDVKLNVGGEIFSAKVADLTRISGTMLDRMLDQIWMRSLGSEPMFIDRDSRYFGLILDFLSTNNVKLPHSDSELAAIIQEFYQIDELIAKIVREDRRCFGEGPPFFPKDRVVWRTRNFWRSLSQRGWNFDGNREKIPLCFTHFTLFSPNQVCYLCGAETKDFHGLYKSLFDFPRDFSYVIGEIDKVYGDCCCCDVRFGKSSFVFHIPAKMLRLAE